MPQFSVMVATTWWQRLRGLIGHAPLGNNETLFIPRCRQVHTFGMAWPIDVVFIDAHRRIVRIEHSLPAWRTSSWVKNASGCLEMKAGRARELGWREGDAVDNFLTPR